VADRRPIRSARLAVALVLVGVALMLASAVALAAGGSSASHRSAAGATATTAATRAPASKTPAARKARRTPPLPRLNGWVSDTVGFPQRAVVLVPPAHGHLTAGAISVRENGAPVTGLSFSTLAAGAPGDFGTLLAISQSTSMAGPGLNGAMAAAHGLINAQTPSQPVGLITFDAAPTPLLALGAGPAATASAFFSPVLTGPGDAVGAAERSALGELEAAHLAAGMVIIVSDGVGVSSAPGTPVLRAAAAATHIPIVTIGLQDAGATAASLHALAAQAPGPYLQATPAQLPAVLTGVQRQAQTADVVRWSSVAPGDPAAAISVTVKGTSGSITGSGVAPAAADLSPAVPAAPRTAPAHPAAPAARPTRLSFASSFAPRTTLAGSPGFPTGPAPVADPTPAPTVVATRGFWGSTASMLVVSLACGLLAAIIVLLILRRPSQRAVRLRVSSFVPAEVPVEESLVIAPNAPRPGGPFAMLGRSNWWPPFVEAVQVSRSRHTPIELVKRAAAIGMVLAVVSTVVLGSVVPGLICLLGWPLALRLFVNRAASKQREKFRDTLPVYLQDLASAIRVGRSLVAGLGILAEGAEEPMRSELERAVTDEALGRPLEESLDLVARRMKSTDMDQVALIAALNRRSGSNIAEALDRVAEGARERADLRREIRALTAQAKMSSLVLTALPGVLLAGLSLVSPQYSHPLFHTTMGVVALSVGAVLVAMGWKVMQKITRVEA
jgi:tight adherence protein B